MYIVVYIYIYIERDVYIYIHIYVYIRRLLRRRTLGFPATAEPPEVALPSSTPIILDYVALFDDRGLLYYSIVYHIISGYVML